MVSNIIVAVACNLVATLILLGGILSTCKVGIRIAGLRLFLTIAGGVGAYFLTPIFSNKLLGISVEVAETTSTLGTLLIGNGAEFTGVLSLGSFNSVVYLIIFVVFYLLGTMICNIRKHSLISRVREKSLNKARIKRAKSINPKAERIARKTEWKKMVVEYRSNLKWWRRLLSTLLGAISAVIVGFVVLTPYGFIAKDLNKNGDKQYLVDGYNYTLNGIIQNKIEFDFDAWLVGALEVETEDEQPEAPEEPAPHEHVFVDGVCECGEVEAPVETPCEHSFIEGVCEHCGEAETPTQE